MLTSKIYTIIFLVLIGLFFLWQTKAYKAPEPNYQVLKNDDDIQIRQYPSLIVAQVEVAGKRHTAINTGFRVLADYIFGKNTAGNQIKMTAPVIQQGIKIGMTAPVLQEKNNDKWIIRFIMPDSFTMKTLPQPNNKKITVIELPAKKYAVIRFTGMNTRNNLKTHQKILEDYISKNDLYVIGEPTYAFYNPPWILPFLRRNEIMLEIK